MYYFLSLLTGVLVAVMVTVNGGLSEGHGTYFAAVFVHITGLMIITAITLAKRERPFAKRYHWFFYLGGVIGVFTIVFLNLAFGRISVSAILALGLFGQSLTGIVIDQFGLLGMPKHKFSKGKLIGLLLILSGIGSMISNFEILAVSLSLAAGVTIVAARTLNAKLAEFTNVRISTFYNYLTGFALALAAFLVLGGGEAAFSGFDPLANIYIYTGGAIGVGVVLLSNMTVAKVSAFYLSVLIFIGQIFTGLLIDALISNQFPVRNLIGGVLVVTGLCANLMLDRNKKG